MDGWMDGWMDTVPMAGSLFLVFNIITEEDKANNSSINL